MDETFSLRFFRQVDMCPVPRFSWRAWKTIYTDLFLGKFELFVCAAEVPRKVWHRFFPLLFDDITLGQWSQQHEHVRSNYDFLKKRFLDDFGLHRHYQVKRECGISNNCGQYVSDGHKHAEISSEEVDKAGTSGVRLGELGNQWPLNDNGNVCSRVVDATHTDHVLDSGDVESVTHDRTAVDLELVVEINDTVVHESPAIPDTDTDGYDGTPFDKFDYVLGTTGSGVGLKKHSPIHGIRHSRVDSSTSTDIYSEVFSVWKTGGEFEGRFAAFFSSPRPPEKRYRGL